MQHTPMPRVAAASAIGTILEWYDFALYNAMSGLVFNKIFFPSFDPLVGTLLSFLTYGVGMVARPVGGIICGRLGDMIGRRPMLIATVSTMGATTALVVVAVVQRHRGTGADPPRAPSLRARHHARR
jgi:MFS family permease